MSVPSDALGVYVHLPWCRQVCPYCDFNVALARPGDALPWAAMEEALVAEIEARAPGFAASPAVSLYFGGGTPSLAPPPLLRRVRDAVEARFGFVGTPEVTLEVDPGTVSRADLEALRATGVNRLSLGWQSTSDRTLKVLGRGHDGAGGRAAYAAARAAGFPSVSIDLIFGVPGQSLAELDRDLDAVVELSPEHVSLYALTYHEGTPFYRRRAKGDLQPVDEDTELDMMLRIDARLRAAGFAHYEVSSYGRPGHRAVHNSLYWSGHPYLGIGPGAHSFVRRGWEHGLRWEGVRDPQRYLAAWRGVPRPGLPTAADGTVEQLDALAAPALCRERIMCGLRSVDGLRQDELRQLAPGFAGEELQAALRQGEARGWLSVDAERIAPTELGMRFGDALAALFF